MWRRQVPRNDWLALAVRLRELSARTVCLVSWKFKLFPMLVGKLREWYRDGNLFGVPSQQSDAVKLTNVLYRLQRREVPAL